MTTDLRERCIKALLDLPDMRPGDTELDSAGLCVDTILALVRDDAPKLGDGTPDAALAIGEHAFRAGFARGFYYADQTSRSEAGAVEDAWDEYDPPEYIKALS